MYYREQIAWKNRKANFLQDYRELFHEINWNRLEKLQIVLYKYIYIFLIQIIIIKYNVVKYI